MDSFIFMISKISVTRTTKLLIFIKKELIHLFTPASIDLSPVVEKNAISLCGILSLSVPFHISMVITLQFRT